VFGFAIPFAIATPQQAARAPAAAAVGQPPAASPRRGRILIAEDEPVNREVAVTYLEQRGWQVTATADGKSALEALKIETFDVVLMDVQMPGLDGFAATRLIREGQEPGQIRVPIIGLTAHALKGDREKCLEAGMDDYLAKPVAPAALCAAVERWAASPPSPQPTQEPPGGNPLAFLDARLGADQRAELRSTVLASLTDALGELKAAQVRRDWPQTGFWAHRLKGSLGVFRFTAAANLAEQIEHQATAPQPHGLNARVQALELEIERVETLLLRAPSSSTEP
ncbi:MAG: response regulator, partial [Proteobacteria bacterium]|nr:response regulator [Pseudomonadota bacterium]